MKKTKQTIPEGLESIPNVGPAIAAKLQSLGISSLSELADKDPYQMYNDLCDLTGERHDPCLLDVFISAVSFVKGGPSMPWWAFTAERKKRLGRVE